MWPTRVNRSTFPQYLGSSVVNDVSNDITMTSYGGSVPRMMPHNYTLAIFLSVVNRHACFDHHR